MKHAVIENLRKILIISHNKIIQQGVQKSRGKVNFIVTSCIMKASLLHWQWSPEIVEKMNVFSFFKNNKTLVAYSKSEEMRYQQWLLCV